MLSPALQASRVWSTLPPQMDSHEALQLLKSFALRAGRPTVGYAQFAAALRSRAVAESEVDSALRELAGKGECALSPEQGPIVTVTLPRFHLVALAEHYRQITVDPARPFPAEDGFPVPIPAEDLAPIEVKTQFVSLLDGSAAQSRGVVKLVFPAGAGSLLVPRGLVATALVEAAVAKVSDYLHNGKNAAYAENKICGLMRGNEIIGLERQIRDKVRSQQDISKLDKRLTSGLQAMQLLADAFRETVAAMNKDFEALKSEVADLKARVDKLGGGHAD